MADDANVPILIAGAGIAGLVAAIRCAQSGRKVVLLEARDQPGEAGAGIQLGPNATRILHEFGIDKKLSSHACTPTAIVARTGASLAPLATLPLGAWIAQRHEAPYWTLHRHDLHRALFETATAFPQVAIRNGFRAVDFVETGDGVSVRDAGGRVEAGACLIAADGLWSALRNVIAAAPAARYSGKCAARTVVPRTGLPDVMRAKAVGVWFSPFGHLVHYPVHAGEAVAVVVVTSREKPGSGWGHHIAADACAADIRRIAPAMASELARGQGADWAAAANWRQWPLFDPAPLPAWHRGRALLIGDAAHPVLPFLAQGGGLAIEDGAVVGALIDAHDGDAAAAFSAFMSLRRKRARKVQDAARRNGQIYQAAWPLSAARDLALRLRSGDAVMREYDWLYGWRLEA